MYKRKCSNCQTPNPDKGRAVDGRRSYRCKCCKNVWTEGLQGRKQKFSVQRLSCQFFDSKRLWSYAMEIICLIF